LNQEIVQNLNVLDKFGSPNKRNYGVFRSERSQSKKALLSDEEAYRIIEALNMPK